MPSKKLKKLEKKVKQLDKWEKIAILVFIFAFGIRLAYHQHGLWIDEGNDLNRARDLWQEGRYKGSRRTRIFYHTILALFLLFSGSSTFAGELAIILMGSATVFLTFLIGKEVYNSKAGVFASILLALYPLHWFLSPRVLSDVPVTFMVALTSYLFLKAERSGEKKTLYLAAVALGLSALTKSSGLITILPISLYLLIKNKDDLGELASKRYLVSFLILAGIVVTWFLVTYLSPGGYAFKTAISQVTQTMEKKTKTAPVHPSKLYYLKNLVSILRLPLTLIFIFGLFMVLLSRFKGSLYPLFWFGVFLIIASLLEVKVPRYLLPLSPAVCLIGGFGLDKLRRDLKGKQALILVAIILLVVSYFQFSMGSSLIKAKSTGWMKLGKAGKWLKAHTNKGEKIIASSAGQIRWFSNRKCYGSAVFKSKERFLNLTRREDVKYVELDTWEVRMRQKNRRWIFSYLKEHNETFVPVKAFRVNNRPVIIIYRIVK